MSKFVVLACAAIVAAQALAAQNFHWDRLGGPDTLINSFAIHNNILFAATEKGIYRTNDEGNTWLLPVLLNDTLANTPVSAIHSYDGFFWAGIRKRPGITTLYRSSDSGNSWSAIQNFGGTDVRCFATGISHFFVGCTNGIARTSNSGRTWRHGLSEKTYTICIANSFIFSGVNGFVTVSKDTGNSTYTVNPPAPQAPVGALHYLGDSTLLAGVSYNDGVYRTTNFGVSWKSYSVGMTGTVAVSVYCFHAAGQYLFAGSSEGIYYSTNNGAKWQQINNGLTVPGDSVWALQAHGDYLFAGTNHGIFRAKLPSVSVEEQQQLSGNSIFPNPAAESFTVRFPPKPSLQASGSVSVTVRDVFGRVVLTGAGGDTFSTAGLAAGVYFVEAAAGGRTYHEKVIIHR